MIRMVVAIALFFIFGSTAWAEDCVGQASPLYHPSYFEKCGAGEDPILKAPYLYFTVWFEATTPFGKGGEVCFDNFQLNRKGVKENIIPADFSKWERWDHMGSPMCESADESCTQMKWDRNNDPGKWGKGTQLAPNSSSQSSLCVKLNGEGKHTHAWALKAPFNLLSAPEGSELELSVWVKIKGDGLQVRSGIDFFGNKDSRKGPMKAVNGRVLQGSYDWTLLKLR